MTGVCPWSHHPQPLPPGKGISQGLVSSWGEAGVLGAALPLQHTTPDPGSTQNLMLQAALKLRDQLQKVTLSVDLHPTIRHVPPFPQNHLRPAPCSPSASHCAIHPCHDFPAPEPTIKDEYHPKIFFQVGTGVLQQCVTGTSNLQVFIIWDEQLSQAGFI